MAQQTSQYGFGSIVEGPLPRPEPARAPVRLVSKPDLLTRFRWTDRQFQIAQRFDFPRALRRPGRDFGTVDLVWSERELDRWRDDLRGAIAALNL